MNAQNRQNFARFREKLIELGADLDDSARRVISQAADIGFAATKKNTPVGVYSRDVHFFTRGGEEVRFTTGFKKQGGHLRRMWVKRRARKAGNAWVAEYSNNTDYVLYVNNGHRIVNKDGATIGYKQGERMLEKGIDEARGQMETLFRLEIERVKNKTGF